MTHETGHPNTEESRPIYDFAPELKNEHGVSAVTVIAPWLLWSDDKNGEERGWTVALRFERRDGATELVDLHVFSTGEAAAIGRGFPLPPSAQARWNAKGGAVFRTTALFEGTNYQPGADPPPGGITTRLLRKYPLGKIETQARRYLAEHDPLHSELPDWSDSPHRRPGRRGRGDLFYAQVAAEYVALVNEGNPAPVRALAERQCVARTTIRNVLSEARRRELLTRPSKKGAADGSLTMKARSCSIRPRIRSRCSLQSTGRHQTQISLSLPLSWLL